MTLAARLKKIFDASGLKQAEFALAAGMPLDRFKNLLGDKVKKVSTEEVRNLSARFHVQELWISTGKGPMQLSEDDRKLKPATDALRNAKDSVMHLDMHPEYKLVLQEILLYLNMGDSTNLQKALGGIGRSSGLPEEFDLVLVPAYGVKASAGNGVSVQDEEVIGHFALPKPWIARKGLNPASLSIVTAKGDSMDPTVRTDDILLIDRDVTRLAGDGIYLLERDNDLYCKRLQKRFDGGVTIMSDNTLYEPQHLSADAASALNVIGRVVWIGGER